MKTKKKDTDDHQLYKNVPLATCTLFETFILQARPGYVGAPGERGEKGERVSGPPSAAKIPEINF